MCFNVKDKMVINHKHDTAYYAKCPKEFCSHDYVGESGKRALEQVNDHFLSYF